MSDSPSLSAATLSLLEKWPLYDNAIVRHGFLPYMRDYEVEVSAGPADPDGSCKRVQERYRLLFTHCVVANITTSLKPETWSISWDEVFTDHARWERAGCPAGFVWGVNWMNAYPGASYQRDSPMAAEWALRLSRPMHEVRIETNALDLTLVFHDLRAFLIGREDAATGELTTVDPVELVRGAT